MWAWQAAGPSLAEHDTGKKIEHLFVYLVENPRYVQDVDDASTDNESTTELPASVSYMVDSHLHRCR